MSHKRRFFDKDFKLKAIQMVNRDKLSRTEVAKRLNVSQTMITNWLRLHTALGEEAFSSDTATLDVEVRQLEQENERLRREVAILQRSVESFSSLLLDMLEARKAKEAQVSR